MSNSNCLEGNACPQCGHDQEVLINACMWVSVVDDGTDPYADSVDNLGGVEYDDNSDAICPRCGYNGKLAEWTVGCEGKENKNES